MKTELALLLTHDTPVMTLEEVAALFGVASRTLENRIYRKDCPIPMFKVGGNWAAHISDVAKYIDAQREDALKLLEAGA
jgi:hypothetical protein